ncbi:hypothetical protein [Herbiconiux daphne]|uniref:Uncharacterized protein n=1 Tax=Herbiconiux daphne TaxID=2970914 RepID=A0ABT2H6I2_9MICO|nr:hypothetical protein [Herbiconiux daphne]MCS5735553.1 hypothetical protein [Herbiconiux daphne]
MLVFSEHRRAPEQPHTVGDTHTRYLGNADANTDSQPDGDSHGSAATAPTASAYSSE